MDLKTHISDWLRNYCVKVGMKGYVVGVSGGIDSAVTSTLCALTGLPTIVVTMPIHQAMDQHTRGSNHCRWLTQKYENVSYEIVNLTKVYDEFNWQMPEETTDFAFANSKARLRMTALYTLAGSHDMLVAGTGNKVEDYGLGFFTKFGDGGVDVSPIGELTKTEVWNLGRELGVSKEIIDAPPTDGLHADNRTDESQLGATYPELEWAMWYYDSPEYKQHGLDPLNEDEKRILNIYKSFHEKNSHKMRMPDICPKLKN